jgi:hypothetical protein
MAASLLGAALGDPRLPPFGPERRRRQVRTSIQSSVNGRRLNVAQTKFIA